MTSDSSFSDVRIVGRVVGVSAAAPGAAEFEVRAARRGGGHAVHRVRAAAGQGAAVGEMVRVLGELDEGGVVAVAAGFGEFTRLGADAAPEARGDAAPAPRAPTGPGPAPAAPGRSPSFGRPFGGRPPAAGAASPARATPDAAGAVRAPVPSAAPAAARRVRSSMLQGHDAEAHAGPEGERQAAPAAPAAARAPSRSAPVPDEDDMKIPW